MTNGKTESGGRRVTCNSVVDCVEVTLLDGGNVEVRDTKLGDGGPVLTFTRAEWDAFIESVKVGEFDCA